MNSPPPDPPSNGNDCDHHKDSCTYSVDIAKQFITLGSAGAAFVVAAAVAPGASVGAGHYWVFGFFAGCVGLGLLYTMSVVGHIQQDKNYNVYSAQLRILAILQIVAFLIGLVLLVTIIGINKSSTPKQSTLPTFRMKTSKGDVEQLIPNGQGFEVKIEENGAVTLQVEAVSPKKESGAGG